MQSSQVDKIFPALFKAQSEMGAAVKKADNPYFKSKYADLATVQGVCEKPLADNALLIIQGGGVSECGNYIYTRIVHESGQWIESQIALPPIGKPQDMGSAITYYRRYGLAAILNITQEDDDGNAASRPEDNGQKPDAASMQKAGIQRANSIKEYHETNLLHDAEVDAALKKCKVSKLSDLSKTVADELIALGVKREKEL